MDGRMNGWMDGWMNGWMDGWMDGWKKETQVILSNENSAFIQLKHV